MTRQQHRAPKHNPHKSRGFTLIEIMVVIIVIGLLAAIVVPNVIQRADDAAISKARVDISGLMGALKMYRLDNYRYPSSAEGLQALVSKPASAKRWRGPYIDVLPLDPWEKDYRYSNPGSHGFPVEVFTYGADDQQGGEDVNADIGNWDIR
ncbi:type II secretion system major pseudopilin GspG [Pseudomaricurvus alkylphenolicus]|uniref:type II secretion system major pseudopilin GspG n=1 Tax=Pseudomaricurvus alkylphenolicus TaxID=1306991 RepID=UPI0014248F45|nr:type II secretion system major pseudopilin GspG [Pseudomaricurvus alkylphenolicus]NIB41414.1 type II secretion system major pseudopilin GspG [Pseudomaricurvus alkylphenolicus]